MTSPRFAAVPTGTWKADPLHSTVGFAVKHMAVGSFKGGFNEFEAKLENGALSGTAKVASVNVKDEHKRTWARTTRLQHRQKAGEGPHTPQLSGKYAKA